MSLAKFIFAFSLIFNSISINPGQKFPFSPNHFTDYSPIGPITEFIPEMINYFGTFASIGYCSQNEILNENCCPDFLIQENWELLDQGINPNDQRYNYGIYKNDIYKKIVITVPGTRNTQELLSEMIYSMLIPFDLITEMRVVKYFKDKMWGIKDQVFSEKNKKIIKTYNGFQVIFIGHSLGGAVATLLSLYAVNSNFIDPISNDPVLITFGQPRTGNDVFANEVMKNIPHVFRVVRQGDMVPTVPECVKSIFGSCKTVFPNNKFDYNYELKKRSMWKEFFRVNVNYWHIGGLIMINPDITEITYCDYDQGENFQGDCNNKKKMDVEFHSFYLNKKESISAKCSSYF